MDGNDAMVIMKLRERERWGEREYDGISTKVPKMVQIYIYFSG